MKQAQVNIKIFQEFIEKNIDMIFHFQQLAPTSEHMMLDRLQIADLKDEIVSLQNDVQLGSVPIKKEVVMTTNLAVNDVSHSNQCHPVKQNIANQIATNLQEPSQILKAKQEQKIIENIKQEQQKLKVEVEESSSNRIPNSTSQNYANTSSDLQFLSHSSKFNCIDKPKSVVQSSFISIKSHQQTRIDETKKDVEIYDIESEIRPNLIMKKSELTTSTCINATSSQLERKSLKFKEKKEREFSPLSDFFDRRSVSSKSDASHDPIYDDWFSVKKDIIPRKRDASRMKNQSKCIENDLSDIFETHASPKTVEKQLDDLFNSNSKSNDLLSSSSPLAEFFQVDSSQMNEKSVENRLEALFGDDVSRKESNQDLVESRLEQLFQGSVSNDNDNSVTGSSNFLYKNNELAYEVGEKNSQIVNSNKRQWNGDCDMIFGTSNSILFPSSPTSKRVCTTQSVNFDSKWIEDSFDFSPDINMISESMGTEIAKQRVWNGNIDNRDSINVDVANTSHFSLPSNNTTSHGIAQNVHDNHSLDLMDSQMPNLNYEDPDDISRQVQNAIDSILNLQTSDPLSYSQLDSSFLEVDMNAMASVSTINNLHSSNAMDQRSMNQYELNRSDHLHDNQTFKQNNLNKRKFLTKMDAIGDCLIGGTNLDHSPSSLVTDSQGTDSAASVGEFVNNLLNCEEKSITS